LQLTVSLPLSLLLLVPVPLAGVSVFSMHPGWADTEGVRTSIPGFHAAFKAKLRDAAQGVDTIVWLALEDASKLQPGAFYLDRQPQEKHLTLGGTKYSKAQAAELYAKVLGMANLAQSQGADTAAAGDAPVQSPAAGTETS
jgi:dehydrogenase/reductase SDR family protein 12